MIFKENFSKVSFVTALERMTPFERINQGENLSIDYSYNETIFGKIIVANTTKGICHLAFESDRILALQQLQLQFPNATFQERLHPFQENVINVLVNQCNNPTPIQLHLNGTDFQWLVWNALLDIPFGQLVNYGKIAHAIGNGKAHRAVGTAISNNPIAWLIPCHRVILSSGKIGEYRWGKSLKEKMIDWESTQQNG